MKGQVNQYVAFGIMCLLCFLIGSAQASASPRLAIIAGFPAAEAVQTAQAFEKRGYKIAKYGLSYGENSASQQRISDRTVVKLLDLNNVYVAEATLRQYLETERLKQQIGVDALLVNAFGVEDETLEYLADNLGLSLRNLNMPQYADQRESENLKSVAGVPARDLDDEDVAGQEAGSAKSSARQPPIPSSEMFSVRKAKVTKDTLSQTGPEVGSEKALQDRRGQQTRESQRKRSSYGFEAPRQRHHRMIDRFWDSFFQPHHYAKPRHHSYWVRPNHFEYGLASDPFHHIANHFYATHPRFGIESAYRHAGLPGRLGQDFYMPRGVWGF